MKFYEKKRLSQKGQSLFKKREKFNKIGG